MKHDLSKIAPNNTYSLDELSSHNKKGNIGIIVQPGDILWYVNLLDPANPISFTVSFVKYTLCNDKKVLIDVNGTYTDILENWVPSEDDWVKFPPSNSEQLGDKVFFNRESAIERAIDLLKPQKAQD